MTEFRARIGRVRLKGGADLHILHNAMPHKLEGKEENWRGSNDRH